MTDVSAVNSSTSSGMSTTTANSVQALDENYNLFLSVLTAQLQNQNPLDPTDTDEMTNQLISYSQVEQQILANQYLENLVLSTNNQSASVALDMVGMDVTYDGQDLTYEAGEELNWSYEVPEDLSSLTAQITNEDGDVVYTEELDTTAGDMTYTWDGDLDTGGTASSGTYSLSFVAKDANGDSADVGVTTTSRVSEVDWSDGTAQLVMENGSIVPLSKVTNAASV